MLVLSRKVNQSILIGPEIAVAVVRQNPNGVRLGIDAPRNLNIVRAELVAGGDEQLAPLGRPSVAGQLRRQIRRKLHRLDEHDLRLVLGALRSFDEPPSESGSDAENVVAAH